MPFKKFFKSQFSSVIEWKNQETHLLWWKYPSYNNEIINASKLIISPGQGAALVYEGEIQDVLEKEKLYNLKTDNHPFITKLVKVRQLFESEHKLEIYFYRKADVLNQLWGISQPVKYVDSKYKFPVSLGANGTFAYKIASAQLLSQKIIGSKEIFTTHEMRELVMGKIPSCIKEYLAQSGHSVVDIDAHLEDIAQGVQATINTELEGLGLELLDFKVIGTSFDENTMKQIDKIQEMTTDVLLAEQGDLSYVELEKLRAMRDAAKNEGGLAGAGLQFGVGMELGKKLDEKADSTVKDTDEMGTKLKRLKLLLNEGILTQEEFDKKKMEVINQFL